MGDFDNEVRKSYANMVKLQAYGADKELSVQILFWEKVGNN